MDPIEASRLTPTQLALLFALSLPLAALPTLYIFIVDTALFERLDTGKLLLLSFSVSAPIFGAFYGVAFISSMPDSLSTAKEQKSNVLSCFYVASSVTALLYLAFGIFIIQDSEVPLDPLRKAMIAPIAFGVVIAYAVLLTDTYKSRRKQKAKNQALPSTVTVVTAAADAPVAPNAATADR